MKILVVSDREYKITSRGIDLITTLLADKGHLVDHMVFLRSEFIPEKQISQNIKQFYFYDFPKLYHDQYRPIMPGFILRFYFSYIIKNQKQINFLQYDWVILESGYPLYFSLVLNNKIIYRMSDPPEISFNSNRSFYKKLENHTIKKAIFVSSASKECFYPNEYSYKFVHCHSGFKPLIKNKNYKVKKEFVYMGGGEIDIPLINIITNKYPDYIFHIIGYFKNNLKKNNVIFHGYLEYEKYQNFVLESSVCIVPYSKRFAYMLRKCYYSAKIFLPMSLGIPILVKNYGLIQNSDTEKKLFVYKTHKEAISFLDNILEKIETGEINRDVSKETRDFLFPHTAENRMKELDKTFTHWIR